MRPKHRAKTVSLATMVGLFVLFVVGLLFVGGMLDCSTIAAHVC